jgi:hypothetical protein
MPGFLSDAQMKNEVAAALRKDPADLGVPPWDAIITRANQDAYGDILRRLANRGFTKAEIDQWDDGPGFQSRLGCFWALLRGGGPAAADEAFLGVVRALDCRKELDTCAVLIGGAIAVPLNTQTADTVGSGRIAGQADDVFHGSFFDPDSTGGGNVRW